MLGFDREFQNGTSKITKAWVNLTLTDGISLEYHEDRVLLNGIVRDSSTTIDGQFTVGAAVTGKMTVLLDNSDDVLSAYDFRDAVMIVWLGGIKTDGSMEKVNVGRYYIDEYSYDGCNVSLVGYDDMSKFDVPCKGSSFTFNNSTTIDNLIGYAISSSVANIPLYNAELPVPEGIRIAKQPKQWETMTWHDVIAYAAQIMCCFAYIVYDAGTYKLKFGWYDIGTLMIPLWDGGTFNHFANYTDGGYLDGGTFETSTTPYSDGDVFDGGSFNTTTTPYSDGGDISGGIITGAVPYPDGVVLDGGTFNPWTEGDWADGGIFGDRDGAYVVRAVYDMSVDTDDILITGVTVTVDPSNNVDATDDTKTYTTTRGEAGYVISIGDNPLIETTGIAYIVCGYLYSILNGMRFRVLDASAVENPDITAGDTAYVSGRNDVVYPCFVSHVNYTVNAATAISCDAESGKQNLKPRFTGSQKTEALIQRTFDRAVSDIETAMNNIFSSYASSMGLYPYPQETSSGTIYTYGNKPTLAASDIRWRFSAGSLSVSTDYGQTWNAALSADGVAVLNRLYAVGIDADYINTGSLKVTNGSSTIFSADINNGLVTIGGFNVSWNALWHSKSTFLSPEDGVYLGPAGLAIGDFRVYPSMNTISGNAIGTVMFGNVQVQYSWSSSSERKFNLQTGTFDVAASSSIYFNVSNYHILSMIYGAALHMSSNGDIYITSNGGNGNIYLQGNVHGISS